MKAWRNSASLILVARQENKCKDATYDYKLLNLKRNKNASFMPESYVFPGGVVEPSDADPKWNGLFSTFGFDSNSLAPLLAKNSRRPPIFQAGDKELPRDISLRITTIRETFEECGILMCRRASEKGILTKWAQNFVTDDLKTWQTKVHNDATEFYRLCEELQCYPDIWSLYEWSNWLTPTFFSKRFDAVFYMAFMPEQPFAEFESQEMEDLKWLDPKELLCVSNNYQLPPPQYYEITRISKFRSLDNLLHAAIACDRRGVHLNFPVQIQLSDGVVSVLPGDSMYPKDINLTQKLIVDRKNMTMAECREKSPVKNRVEYYSSEEKILTVDDFENKDGNFSSYSSKL